MGSFQTVLDEVMEDPNVMKNVKEIQDTLGRLDKKMATDPSFAGKAFEIGGVKKGLDGLLQNLSLSDMQAKKLKEQELAKQKKDQLTKTIGQQKAVQTGIGTQQQVGLNKPASPMKNIDKILKQRRMS